MASDPAYRDRLYQAWREAASRKYQQVKTLLNQYIQQNTQQTTTTTTATAKADLTYVAAALAAILAVVVIFFEETVMLFPSHLASPPTEEIRQPASNLTGSGTT